MIRPLVLAFGLLLAASAPAWTQTVPEPSATLSVPQRVEVQPAVEDGQIATRLREILIATEWFEDPQVAVRDGVVFLDGAADSADHRRWAEMLAGNAEGAVAVVNRISVTSSVDSTFGRAAAEIRQIVGGSLLAWPLILLGILVIVVAWLLAKLVGAIAQRVLAPRIASPLLSDVLVRLTSIPVFVLGLYVVLQVAGLTGLAFTLLGGTGILGIIIGFAFRDIAENFLASLLLSVRNPFSRGDLIDVEGELGIVQNLNTRSTVLLTPDGNHVQIPNARVFKSIIKNFSSIPSRRAEFRVGIGYDSSVGETQRLIANVLAEHPAVLNEPEPLVLVEELGDASVMMLVQYWYNSDAYSPARINSALLRLTKNALLQGGIELPDPAREVVFPKGVPIIQAEPAAPASAAMPKPEPVPQEDTSVSTAGEGGLVSENADLSKTQQSVPEATEDLLKG